jgi:hypothetical protein
LSCKSRQHKRSSTISEAAEADKQQHLTISRHVSPPWRLFVFHLRLRLFELAVVLVRLDHIASFIVNANHSAMCAAALLRVPDGVADGIRPIVPKATERECIANEIDTAFIFAGPDFVKVSRNRRWISALFFHLEQESDSSAILGDGAAILAACLIMF